MVEHDEEAIQAADHVIDIGPGAGIHGGDVLYAGPPNQIGACEDSLTGQYLTGKKSHWPKKTPSTCQRSMVKLIQATAINLQAVDTEIPLGLMTCVTGVSGSGKSSLINAHSIHFVPKNLTMLIQLSQVPIKT